MQSIFAADDSRGKASSGKCLDEETIAVYLDNGLSKKENQKLQEHIKTCNRCFHQLAGFYKNYHNTKQEEIQHASLPVWLNERILALNQPDSASVAPAPKIKQPPAACNLPQILSWIKKILASPIPAYALAGVLLMFFIKAQPDKSSRLLSFPQTTDLWVFDKVAVAYKNTTTAKAPVLDEGQALYREPNFDGMTVKEKKDQGLVFNWPQIKDTHKYRFSLSYQSGEKEQVLVSIITSGQTYEYSYEKYGRLVPDRLYKWVVSGNYGEGLYFKAKSYFAAVK